MALRKRLRAPRSLGLLLVALAAGAFFFASLGRLWPLAATDLTVPRAVREGWARAFLQARGFDLTGYASASSLFMDEEVVDYVERALGRASTQALITGGVPFIGYNVVFRKAGEADGYSVSLHPSGQILRWSKEVPEDAPGRRIEGTAARAAARRALREGLGLDLREWREVGVSERALPERLDRVFTLERPFPGVSGLRERVTVRVAGAEVINSYRRAVLPPRHARALRRAETPRTGLEAVGNLFFAIAVVAAFSVFLLRLRDGSVHLERAAFWSAVVFVCASGTYLLQEARLFQEWDTFLPRWVDTLQRFVSTSQNNVWTFAILLAVVAAGDALDRQVGGGRGESLWLLSRGRLAHPKVGAASARGFLVGLICGGVMALSVLLLEWLAGAHTALQPRGFFFSALNSSAPALSTLLFFLNIALLEELGYRFFAGTWILSLTRRKWLAILLPALIYGLTHTTMSFLPPEEPFWGRALVMTLVGCVWGWAFFRYDALTVVFSHLSADLFIFNWPGLASGNGGLFTTAVLTIGVPLLPAVAWLARGAREKLARSGAASLPD